MVTAALIAALALSLGPLFRIAPDCDHSADSVAAGLALRGNYQGIRSAASNLRSLQLRGGGFHKSRKIRMLHNWKPKHKREGENPLQVHKAHRMRKKEKDRSAADRMQRNIAASVKMQDREALHEQGLIQTPEVTDRYRYHQRRRAEALAPVQTHPAAQRGWRPVSSEEHSVDSAQVQEQGEVDHQSVPVPASEKVSDLDELLGPVSDFSDDSVDQFLKAHPEASVRVKFVGDDTRTPSPEPIIATETPMDLDSARPTVAPAQTSVMKADGLMAGGSLRTLGDGLAVGGAQIRSGASCVQPDAALGCHAVSGAQTVISTGAGVHAGVMPGNVTAREATGSTHHAGTSARTGGEEVTFVKGENVLYRTGNGSLDEACVIAVDSAIIPPSYTISYNEGANVRETEAYRLIKMPAQGGGGAARTETLRGVDWTVCQDVDGEEAFYNTSSGAILHPKLRLLYGTERKRPARQVLIVSMRATSHSTWPATGNTEEPGWNVAGLVKGLVQDHSSSAYRLEPGYGNLGDGGGHETPEETEEMEESDESTEASDVEGDGHASSEDQRLALLQSKFSVTSGVPGGQRADLRMRSQQVPSLQPVLSPPLGLGLGAARAGERAHAARGQRGQECAASGAQSAIKTTDGVMQDVLSWTARQRQMLKEAGKADERKFRISAGIGGHGQHDGIAAVTKRVNGERQDHRFRRYGR